MNVTPVSDTALIWDEAGQIAAAPVTGALAKETILVLPYTVYQVERLRD